MQFLVVWCKIEGPTRGYQFDTLLLYDLILVQDIYFIDQPITDHPFMLIIYICVLNNSFSEGVLPSLAKAPALCG